MSRRTIVGWDHDAGEDFCAVVAVVVNFDFDEEARREKVIRRKLARLPKKLERFCWRVLRHRPPTCSRATFYRLLAASERLLKAMK